MVHGLSEKTLEGELKMAQHNAWNLFYVVGNPAMFSRVTDCSDNPMSRKEALEAAQRLADNGWRVWVEHKISQKRIFESPAEQAARA